MYIHSGHQKVYVRVDCERKVQAYRPYDEAGIAYVLCLLVIATIQKLFVKV